MRTIVLLLALGVAAVSPVPRNPQKIVGGSAATINQYPSIAALLYSWNLNTYWQACGGVILSHRSILTAAHCVSGDAVNRWRVRLGSTLANAGGVVFNVNLFIIHPNYKAGISKDNDIAVLRTATTIAYIHNAVQPGIIAGSNYYVPDNSVVWAAGWGLISYNEWPSEMLLHVQIWTVNQAICRARYLAIGKVVTNNMLCSGWLDVGGRDQCLGDSGGPLYLREVVIGIYSWGHECGLARYPGVNVRVSRYFDWIQQNA